MSHLAHDITVKQALIAAGVTNPTVQTDTTRSAYVRALASFDQSGKTTKGELADFYQSILSYWNETSPIKGALIIAELRKFNADLIRQMSNLGTVEGLKVDFPRPVDLPENIKVHELDGFPEMVQALIDDCNKKLAHWREDGRFQGMIHG